MLTVFLMFVAAWAAVMLDAFTLDAEYGSPDSFTTYATEPWRTITRAGRVLWGWISE